MNPILLKPTGKDYLWGGTRLKNEYNKKIDKDPLAETWECSAHHDGVSICASGPEKGMLLSELIKQHPEYKGNKNKDVDGLPILVKFIDANKDLSVQVHPDDAFARKYEHDNGKTEMWYVLDALPGSSLVCGFSHNVSSDMLYNDVQSGMLMKHLNKVPIKKGDVFYIPAGTVHAIGAGALIAEIQESSNVTYRVWDYDRIDKNGKKRETHLEKALQVLNMKSISDIKQKPRKISYFPGFSTEDICRCEYFEVEKLQVSMAASFFVDESSFQVLLCLEGSGGIESAEMKKPLRIKKGDCVFIPSNIGKCYVIGNIEVLKIRC